MNKQIGYNFAGFLENKDTGVDADVMLLSENALVYERAPGGAITSKANPYKYRNGWGINMECIDQVLREGDVDEDGSSREKWIEKMNEQPGHSYMDDMIDRHRMNQNLRLIWVANCLSASMEDNLNAIIYMVSNGVRITHVEADNEAYSKGKYKNFDAYFNKYFTLFYELRQIYPEIKFSICLAPFNKGVEAHELWNEGALRFKDSFDCASIHFYYNEHVHEDEVGLGDAFESFPELHNPVDFTEGNEQLQKCFEALRGGLFNNGGWENEIQAVKEFFPGKPILITEFNTKPAERFCNTLVNEAWVFMTFLQHDEAIDVLCVHNGSAPAGYGRWSKWDKRDNVPMKGQVRRLGFYALQLISEIDALNSFPAANSPMTIMSAGKFYAYFTNLFNAPVEFIISAPVGLRIVSSTINYVQGSRLYSSSGSTGWMPSNQPSSYEIDGIDREVFTNHQLPSFSFGYICFEVVPDTPQEPTPKPVRPVAWWRKLLQKWFGMRAASKRALEPFPLAYRPRKTESDKGKVIPLPQI